MVKTELELEVQPFLGHRKSQLGQPGDRPRREFVVREVGKRIASPDRIGLGQQFGGRSERAGGGQRPPFGSPLLEPPDVDVVPCQLQGVAVASHDNEVGRPQRTSELRRQPLQTVAHRRRRIVAPQRLDQVLRRDHPAHVQGQDRQQRAQLRAHHGHDVPLVVHHLEFPEQPDVHELTVPETRPSTPSDALQCRVSPGTARWWMVLGWTPR